MCIRDRLGAVQRPLAVEDEAVHVGVSSGQDAGAGGSAPVSYTHLDVYKRQVEYP